MAIDNIKFAYGGIIVYVAAMKVQENFTNGIKIIPYATTDDSPNTPFAINLNKVENRYTVTGYLNNGKLHATETYTSAEDKKNALKTMFGKGSVVVMTWEGTDIDIAIDKYEMTYNARDDDDMTQDGEIAYDVIISGANASDIV